MHNQSPRVRLALVCSTLRLSGAEKQTVYIARALREAGIDARFFYLGAGGYYESVLREAGIPLQRLYTANSPWLILARLIGAFCQWRPHVVLIPQFGDLLYGIAGRVCNALTVGGVRSDGVHDINSHGLRGWVMLRVVHGFIANSRRAGENLLSRGVQRRKIEVLPNVIDLQDFDSRSTLEAEIPVPSNRVIVAAVGRLHECKRFDRFMEALALARRRAPSLAGMIVGADCGAQTELQEKAKSLHLTQRDLLFVGESHRVPALLNQAGLLVLSSDYEGFPNVILEGMAARLPVITTRVGDAGVVVQHGKTGYVVEREDTEGMAEFMIRLAQSESMRITFGEAGRQRVEKEYNYESLAERLVGILHRFAGEFGRASLLQMLDRLAGQTAAMAGTMRLESYSA